MPSKRQKHNVGNDVPLDQVTVRPSMSESIKYTLV